MTAVIPSGWTGGCEGSTFSDRAAAAYERVAHETDIAPHLRGFLSRITSSAIRDVCACSFGMTAVIPSGWTGGCEGTTFSDRAAAAYERVAHETDIATLSRRFLSRVTSSAIRDVCACSFGMTAVIPSGWTGGCEGSTLSDRAAAAYERVAHETDIAPLSRRFLSRITSSAVRNVCACSFGMTAVIPSGWTGGCEGSTLSDRAAAFSGRARNEERDPLA